jgi:hypothetical protein
VNERELEPKISVGNGISEIVITGIAIIIRVVGVIGAVV